MDCPTAAHAVAWQFCSSPARELRELTRSGCNYPPQGDGVDRISEGLEDANISWLQCHRCVGLSGRDMLRAIIAGQDDPEILPELGAGSSRQDPTVADGPAGTSDRDHRFLLKLLLDQ